MQNNIVESQIICNIGMYTYYLTTIEYLICLNIFIAEVETQLGQKARTLQTNRVSVYLYNMYRENIA